MQCIDFASDSEDKKHALGICNSKIFVTLKTTENLHSELFQEACL